MNINTRIWENSITDLPQGDQQAEQFEHYAREFFIPDSIAPSVYLANVGSLMEQAAEESGVQPTPSAAKMALSMQHPIGFPTWFLAAYPDVALWFTSQDLSLIHISEPTRLGMISYAVFCLKKKKKKKTKKNTHKNKKKIKKKKKKKKKKK